MKFTRVSPHSGTETTFDLPVCQAQIDRLNAGKPIEIAFANLEDWQRTFYTTGLTPRDTRERAGDTNAPTFAPGDRVVCHDKNGFVLRRAGADPTEYLVKLDRLPDPVRAFETELKLREAEHV